MQDVSRLVATESIRQLASRYAVSMDARDIDALVSLYIDDVRVGHVDAVLDLPGIPVEEGPEHAIPNRQDAPEVGVSPRTFEVMMELVHVRRHEDVAQGRVQPHRG